MARKAAPASPRTSTPQTPRKVARRSAPSRDYTLKPGEPLAAGIKRAAYGRILDSIDKLRSMPGSTDRATEAVHEARKNLKMLRSLLRLVRKGLGEDVFRAENAAFRDAGRELAGARDAHVMIATLDSLRDHGAKKLPREIVTK